MRIGIDGRFLNHPESGHGTYTFELINNLAKIDSKNDYYIFIPTDYKPTVKESNFHFVGTDIPYYSFAEQIKLPKLLKKYQLDLMHFVHFNKPIFYSGKTVSTIHDLTLSYFPHKNFIRQIIYSFIMKRAIRSSDLIITDAKFTQEKIIADYHIDPDKIVVIYLGYSDRFRKITNKPLIKSTLSGYNIAKPYIVYIGQQRIHKNLVRLVEAFSLLRKKGLDYSLVFIGKKSNNYPELDQAIKENDLGKEIIFTGFVPEDKISILLSAAKVLAFPSLMEGFGLPTLEAFACDIPVACSNTTSLPEVGGSAAAYFDPENVEEMANVIYKTLIDKKLRQKLHEKSQIQIKKFSWTKMAEKIYKLYQELAN